VKKLAPIKKPGNRFTVRTEDSGGSFRGETVCPFYVLQPRKEFPEAGV
jgi:hypothetical protein